MVPQPTPFLTFNFGLRCHNLLHRKDMVVVVSLRSAHHVTLILERSTYFIFTILDRDIKYFNQLDAHHQWCCHHLVELWLFWILWFGKLLSMTYIQWIDCMIMVVVRKFTLLSNRRVIDNCYGNKVEKGSHGWVENCTTRILAINWASWRRG